LILRRARCGGVRARRLAPFHPGAAECAIWTLDGPDATAVGVLLAASRTSDITDAHVVICARRAEQPVVTSNPDDLVRLDPNVRLVVL